MAPAWLAAQTAQAPIGVVVMHGKGGAPTKHVAELANQLQAQGYLVANLDMPWSGRREYDADVPAAEAEVEAAMASLRKAGAQKVFVAGHSQGGLFALYFGGKHAVDGIVAIAPGGNAGNSIFREKLGEAVEQARQQLAGGKGQDKQRFQDFETARGTFPVVTTAQSYLSWFDPEGAMNQTKALQALPATLPVLWIAPWRLPRPQRSSSKWSMPCRKTHNGS
jgi:alpha-beta hydrolase superfamily lysophospholipase